VTRITALTSTSLASATSSPTTSSAIGRAIRSPCGGREAYTAKIVDLLAAVPDLRLDLVGSGTGPDGPFAMRDLDRVRTRDGMVVENVIRHDQVEP
jgi:hypothetical protein